MNTKPNIVVAVTGASGSIYARLLIQELEKQLPFLGTCAVVFSRNAIDVWKHELDSNPITETKLKVYADTDFMAPFASGSGGFDAMVICPCSMGTMGRIATGISDSLITRSADVMLKERKKLVLVTRETPLNLIHINNMQTLTQAGAIIFPASPSFYHKPQTIEEAVLTVTKRVLSLIDVPTNFKKWGIE